MWMSFVPTIPLPGICSQSNEMSMHQNICGNHVYHNIAYHVNIGSGWDAHEYASVKPAQPYRAAPCSKAWHILTATAIQKTCPIPMHCEPTNRSQNNRYNIVTFIKMLYGHTCMHTENVRKHSQPSTGRGLWFLICIFWIVSFFFTSMNYFYIQIKNEAIFILENNYHSYFPRDDILIMI